MTEQTNETASTSTLTLEQVEETNEDLAIAVKLVNRAAAKFGDLETRASAAEKSPAEIAAALAETSDDADVAKMRAQIQKIADQITARFMAEAEQIVASNVAPDAEEIAKAKARLDRALKMLKDEDGADSVTHLLRLPESVAKKSSKAGKSALAPTKVAPRDLLFFVDETQVGTAVKAAQTLGVSTAEVLNAYGRALGLISEDETLTHETMARKAQTEWAKVTHFTFGEHKVTVHNAKHVPDGK